MKQYQVEIGPLVGSKRAIWLIGDVDVLKVGDMLVTDSGEKIKIDAIGMSNRKMRNALSVLTASTINPSVKTMYVN